jgi:hypothetical protein
MISSKFVRSSLMASFAALSLFACERNQQNGGATDDTTGTTTTPAERQGSPATGTTGSRDTLQGTGTDRSPGTGSGSDTTGREIERTGGRDMPMGSGGSQGSIMMGTGGHGGGHGGAGGRGH